MPRVLVATRNQGKLAEIERLLAPLGLEVLSLADFPHLPEPEETGATFAENAILKAREAARATGLVALADDSGLEVAALGGQPGVHSKRFAASDPERIARLLDLLASVPPPRAARFVAVVAIASPQGRLEVVEGTVRGTIACAPRGCDGFGYDPVFIPEGEQRTMAEMSREEKNLISHRGQAIRLAAERLRAWLEAGVC